MQPIEKFIFIYPAKDYIEIRYSLFKQGDKNANIETFGKWELTNEKGRTFYCTAYFENENGARFYKSEKKPKTTIITDMIEKGIASLL